MNRFSHQKRNQLIFTSLGIAAALFLSWFFGIRYLQSNLTQLNDSRKTSEDRLAQVLETKKNSAQIEEELLQVSNRLLLQEQEMASGDLYASMVSSIKKFKQAYKVEIPQFAKPDNNAVDMNMLPKYPYRQFTVVISGTASFHDLGRFVADFENEFSTSRVLNLEASPATSANPDDKEKLAFKMDVVSLTLSGTTGTPDKP
jgi:Tfp pilus assembly protein PilO